MEVKWVFQDDLGGGAFNLKRVFFSPYARGQKNTACAAPAVFFYWNSDTAIQVLKK